MFVLVETSRQAAMIFSLNTFFLWSCSCTPRSACNCLATCSRAKTVE